MDPITAIEPEGSEVVYDLTVGDLHNRRRRCGDAQSGAIEQEADIVAFLSGCVLQQGSDAGAGLTELIIASIAMEGWTVKLRFQPEHSSSFRTATTRIIRS